MENFVEILENHFLTDKCKKKNVTDINKVNFLII